MPDLPRHVLEPSIEERFLLLEQMFMHGQISDPLMDEYENLKKLRNTILETRKRAINTAITKLQELEISIKELVDAGFKLPNIKDIYSEEEILVMLTGLGWHFSNSPPVTTTVVNVTNYGSVTNVPQQPSKLSEALLALQASMRGVTPHIRSGHWVNRNGKTYWRNATIVGANFNNILPKKAKK